MFAILLLCSIISFVSADVQLSQLRKMPNLPKQKVETTAVQVLEENQLSYCEACWDVADEALEVWTEIFLYSGTFYSCADFCTVVENWGEGCIAICAILGDEAFFKLLNYTDLDPIYVCQLLGSCPVNDCVGNCVTITNFTVSPNSINVPPQMKDWVDIYVNFNINKKWTGTGVVYYQMEQCMGGNCVFLGNNAALLLPNGYIGNMSAHFTFNYDCPVEFYAGQPIQAQVFICNGNCDEYGVARHPNSALYATTYADIITTGECPE